MRFKTKILFAGMVSAALTVAPVWAGDGGKKEFTIIHTGDFHGHTIPRPNVRSDGDGRMEGGLARIFTKIKSIRGDKYDKFLLLHTGDTLQGSGEALYSQGQAMVDVLDMFKINAYAPGNWDFVYGPARFKELFVGTPDANGNPTSKRWGALVANVYETSSDAAAPMRPTAVGSEQGGNVSEAEYDTYANWYLANGKRILPPYSIKYVNGVKVGIIGCTTSRGPQVVGSWVTEGLEFTDCSREVPKFAEELRTVKGVDMVVLISEIEIGRNIQLMKSLNANQHVDLVLNADMHEESLKPIEVIDAGGGKTLIVEEGMDGTMIGELDVTVTNHAVTDIKWTPHRIHDGIPENDDVKKKVAAVRAPYTTKFKDYSKDPKLREKYHKNFFSGSYLNGSLDEVVGSTEIALHRSNFSHENMPAVVEGSSHDFIVDAMRWWAQSDLATLRGFRYGTTVRQGNITRNDLFHFVPIGPRIGKVSRLAANQIRNQVDNSSRAVFSSDPNSPVIPMPRYNNLAYTYGGANAGLSPGAGLPAYGLGGSPEGWGGGWLFAYSANGGIHFDFAPYFNTNVVYNADNTLTLSPATNTSRARSLTVKLPCKRLPPAEIAATGCDLADTTTRYTTVITDAATGVYTANWKANFTAAQVAAYYPDTVNNAGNCGAAPLTACGYTPYLLNPDGWQFLKGTPNQPNTNYTVNQQFKAGVFSIAGYWYAQSPNTINNCGNCYPTGTSTVVGHPDAPYVLPVNVNPVTGNAALDENGNPIYVRDSSGAVVMENGKPKIEGDPIDLTEIIEKYLAYLKTQGFVDGYGRGKVTAANLPLNRIGLVNNDGTGPITLPDYTPVLGFPTMQPLCGTIGKDAASALLCP